MKGQDMTDKWYGKDATLEEAQEATSKLRELKAGSKSCWFKPLLGQCVVAKDVIFNANAGEVLMIIQDSKDNSFLASKDEADKYLRYQGNFNYFDIASDQQVNALFNVEAKIEEEPTISVETIMAAQKILKDSETSEESEAIRDSAAQSIKDKLNEEELKIEADTDEVVEDDDNPDLENITPEDSEDK